MKKTVILSIVVAVSQLLFSCSKEEKVSKDVSKIASVKTDTLKGVGSKSTLASECKYSSQFDDYPLTVQNVVIANFPVSGNNVILPKRTWRVGNYELNNQSDGNLVLYNWASGSPVAIWDLNIGWNTNPTFQIQTDGNFVAYKGNGQPFWDTGSYVYKCGGRLPRSQRLILTVQGDLTLVCDGSDAYGHLATMILGTSGTLGGQVHTGGQGHWVRYDTNSPNPNNVGIIYN